MLAASAFAAPNVGNPGQKGSLLIFPLIHVRSTATIVHISNNSPTRSVIVLCHYLNQQSQRLNFSFLLTPKQAVMWDVASGDGEGIGPLPLVPPPAGRSLATRGSVS